MLQIVRRGIEEFTRARRPFRPTRKSVTELKAPRAAAR
jgi:hypothetical protein